MVLSGHVYIKIDKTGGKTFLVMVSQFEQDAHSLSVIYSVY